MKKPMIGGLRAGALAVAIAAFCSAEVLNASGAVTFTGSGSDSSNGDGLSASATFTALGGGILQVTLVNTYTGDTPAQGDVLCALFFAGTGSLTPVLNSPTALGTGSVPSAGLEWIGMSKSSSPGGATIGQHWAYNSGLSGAPDSAIEGISCVGLGFFGTMGKGNFASGGQTLDGSSYGILSEGYAGSDKDGLHTNPYLQNAITFDLSGFNGNLGSISDVVFQYGSSTSQPSFVGYAPEPNYGIVTAAFLLPVAGLKLLRSCRRGSLTPA